MSKKTRGEVTHRILKSAKVPSSPQELEAIVAQKFECALLEGNKKNPWVLEVYC
jgi:hypothetical protein